MFADRTNWNLATNRLSEALDRLRAEGKPVIDLTVSNPTECGFEYDAPAILRALSNPAALSYEPNPRGLESARRSVAAYYAEHGCHVETDNIFLTTSTSEAYTYVFRLLCNPGDEILVPAPSYPLFGFLAEIQDVKLVHYPLFYDHGWQIDFHALQQSITPRTRAIIVVHPNNPTGNYAKPSEVDRLNELCRSNHLAILADEVFLDFPLSPTRESCGDASLDSHESTPQHSNEKSSSASLARPTSLACNSAVLTFVLSGLSKISGLPQMKAAWLVVNGLDPAKSQALARLEMIADTYLSPNAPIQHALPTLLDLRHAFQSQLLARTQENLAELDRQLSSHPACRRLHLEAGWYAVLRVPATRSDEDLALQLLNSQNVYVHPGHFFDFPSDGYLVVSLLPRETEFALGIARLLSSI
jgi:aspartate/methionine/tyrosine aminotransferase